MAEPELGGARLEHDDDAAEADRDRQRATPADPFAQHRDREDRDEQRRREDDRVGLRQRKGRECREGRGAGQERGRRAQRHPPRVSRPEIGVARVAHQHDGDDRKAEERAEEQQLERRVVAAQEFHHDVMGRVDREGEEREGRAAGVRTAEAEAHLSGVPGVPAGHRLASSAATIASPISEVVIGVPPSGPSRSGVRAPAASTVSMAVSRRVASSPWSNE